MSTPPMQWMADVDAKLAQFAAQNKSQPTNMELVEAIGARIAREGQTLREDFIGKFAANFLLALETVTKRAVELEEKQTKLEEREQKLEEKTAAHEAKVAEDLEKAEQKQLEILNKFIDALNQHHQINATTLSKQQVAVLECQRATVETAKATALCTSFTGDYEATVKKGGKVMEELTKKLRDDLQSFVQSVKKETSEAIRPAIKKAREMGEAEYLRRARWMMVGAMIILLISTGLTWFAQPSHYMMRDASRWRAYESQLTPDQANRVNKLIDEIETEQRAAEEKKNK
ncbi:MAG: hypothetical protein WBP93_05300 [Pyrinomonadaceae bacterium]